MNNRHLKSFPTGPLTLSQSGAAILLAFVAARAVAAGAPEMGAAAQSASGLPVDDSALTPSATSDISAEPVAPPMPAVMGATMPPRVAVDSLAGGTPEGVLPRPMSALPALQSETSNVQSLAPAASVVAAAVDPEPVEFNRDFLNGSGAANVDMSRFDKGNLAAPGRYRVALYVNGIWVGVTDVTLRDVNGPDHAAQPLFDRDLLARTGVDFTRLSAEASAKLEASNASGGALLPELVPQATAAFDMGEQRLDLSIPQAMMSRNARGWVDPKFWDDGVPAATLQYNSNVYHTNGSGLSNTQGYLGLNAGVNVGAWRFRYNGNLTDSTVGGFHTQSMQTYLQRSFAPIKSQLTLGDSYTDGAVFDSFGVRGVQLGTDDRMYPDSQRGYAPTVRGIANTNAKVSVRQNGNIIYETTVAPGPFEINDLYPTGYGGDLQVVVTEADGSQRISTVPYAAPVNALRAGRWRYSVAAGEYRDVSLDSHPYVFEGSVQRGLNNLFTLYGGSIIAQDYFSAAAGVALNTVVGAFSVDVTQANTNIPRQSSRNGQSLRLSYSRTFEPTSTDVTLAAYRYSTNGFLNIQDAMTLRDAASRGIAYTNNGIQKGRLQVTLNQSLRQYGSVYASGFTQNYWNKGSRDTSYQAGYNANVGRLGVGVSFSRELDVNTAHWDNRFMLNVTIPLDIGAHTVTTQTSYTHDSRDNSDQFQETFTGTAGANNEFSYGATAGYTSLGNNNTSISANAGYLSPFTQIQVNAGHAGGYTQVGGGLTGSIVAYQGGVIASPQTGDTLAIIEAQDAVGARVASSPGVRIDRFGHALVAGMQPYSMNSVEIDTKGLPLGVQLKTTEQHFAPTAGAVSQVKFDTDNRGQAVVMRLRRLNGEPVPFGADVLDENGNNVGTVSQGSRAMFYSKVEGGDLTAKWGEGIAQSCKARYSLPAPAKDKKAAPVFADAICQ
jgi:outer membrane usher protein